MIIHTIKVAKFGDGETTPEAYCTYRIELDELYLAMGIDAEIMVTRPNAIIFSRPP